MVRAAVSHHTTDQKPMKILITGASGYIGTVLREIFVNEEVTLLSRTPITLSRDEKWLISGNLQDAGWWNSLPTDSSFDVVFHLAELVKENVNEEVRKQIINEHVIFISHFANQGAKVVYPLTAYLYDKKLSSSNRAYAGIKRGVWDRLNSNRNISFPIIHPICDSALGLGKLIQTEKRFPLINTMCAFDSTIPTLRLEYLKQIFADPISMAHGQFDVYSEVLAIKDIFKDRARANVFLLSKAIYYTLKFLRFVPSFNLLIGGRHIDHSTIC
jgi:hypothetical protein